MRILHVIPSIDAADGGPSVAVRAMAGGLAHLGHEVVVATTIAPATRGMSPEQSDGVRYQLFSRTVLPGWKFSAAMTRWLYHNVRTFDVINVHAAFSYASIPACRFAERFGVPYVFRPLGTLDPWSLSQKRWKKLPYFHLVERHHLLHASAIHVTSQLEQRALAALGCGAATRVIRLGAPAHFAPHRGELDDHATAPTEALDSRPTILYLSRLHEKKGLPLLFSAVAVLRREFPRLRLVVAGAGSARYERELHELMEAQDLAETVHFAGPVQGETKRLLLESADVFALLSHTENFAIAVAEAMSAGLPVIVSDQVGVADVVEEHGAGIVVPLDLDRAVVALRSVLANSGLRRAMGEKARRAAARHFDWNSTCRDLEALYNEIIAARAARAKRGDRPSRTAANHLND